MAEPIKTRILGVCCFAGFVASLWRLRAGDQATGLACLLGAVVVGLFVARRLND